MKSQLTRQTFPFLNKTSHNCSSVLFDLGLNAVSLYALQQDHSLNNMMGVTFLSLKELILQKTFQKNSKRISAMVGVCLFLKKIFWIIGTKIKWYCRYPTSLQDSIKICVF